MARFIAGGITIDKNMTVEQWLGKDNTLGIDIWERKYRYKDETFDQWLDRVSGGNTELRQLIAERKFLFGGRVLSNRGLNNGNYFNCFSAGYVEDDYEDIMNVAKKLGLTYKAQGGQGVSLSKLRPKGTPIGDRYSSDGIIPFLELYNTVTSITSQAGSRKGALLVSLDIRHKEAEEFITIKTDTDRITKANLSLEIDDEFMSAVDTYYKTGEEIVLHEKRDYSGHTIEYDIVPIKLYKKMMECAYDYGEPGCIFTNRFRNYNLMELDDRYNVETCNPCGEQPLKKDTSCNLGSINLAEFVLDEYTNLARIDYTSLDDAIRIAVTALDDIIDENMPNLPLQIHRDNAMNWRNIGLGVMGLGTALFKLGIKYGSTDAKNFAEDLFGHIFRQAVRVDCKLAIERGAFPLYDERVFDSSIVKKHFINDDIVAMKIVGLRNCSLLSIAPTGSIATMLGVTGGAEPEFAIKYTRKTDNLNDSYDVFCQEAQYYMTMFGKSELPDQFICASDIAWKDRVDMQSVIQTHIDTAISSTVNLPKETTLSEVEQLYLYAWKQGLKGITIFRDGCKRAGVLTTANNNTEKVVKPEETVQLKRGDIIECSEDLIGKKRKLKTGCGSLHVLGFFDPVTGELQECYLNKGSTGGCANFMTGLSRTISLLCRAGVSVYDIKDQLDSTGACPSYASRTATKRDTSKGACCPMAIGNALIEMYEEMQDELDDSWEDPATEAEKVVDAECSDVPAPTGPKCPECGEPLSAEGGCFFCRNCSYSKCE